MWHLRKYRGGLDSRPFPIPGFTPKMPLRSKSGTKGHFWRVMDKWLDAAGVPGVEMVAVHLALGEGVGLGLDCLGTPGALVGFWFRFHVPYWFSITWYASF